LVFLNLNLALILLLSLCCFNSTYYNILFFK